MLRFTRSAIRNRYEIGAFCPSGPRLARHMTKWMQLESSDVSRRVLEVGAGTGPFTREILKNLRPGDRLDVVELQPNFCQFLEEQIVSPFRQTNPGITVEIHNCSILEAELHGPYDDIICGLPFNNFPVNNVDELFDCMLNQLKPSGHMVYFAYMGMAKLKLPLLFVPRMRRSINARKKLMAEIHQRCHATKSMVLRNVPPAWACSLCAVPTISASPS